MRVARPAQYTVSVCRTPTTPSAWTYVNTSDTGTRIPSERSARQNVTTERVGPETSANSMSSMGGRRLDQRSELAAGTLCVLSILEHRAKRAGRARLVEHVATEGVHRPGPVDGLGDPRSLVEAHRPKRLNGLGDLPGQLLARLGDP